jgi:transposase
MSTVTTIGLDIAKSVFQVHGISATGEVLIRRQVRRGQVLKFFASLPPCLVGIEACASAHHCSRELQSLGHQVKLMGALAVIRYAQRHGTRRPWIVQLLARRATKVAAVALANKMARMVWAIMAKGERYREPVVGQAA